MEAPRAPNRGEHVQRYPPKPLIIRIILRGAENERHSC